MKITDLKNVNLVADSEKSADGSLDLSALMELVQKQGDFSAISVETAEQLRNLKLEAGDGQLPEGAFVRFSIDVLSHQGTWNFFKNGKDFGSDITTIPDEWLDGDAISLERLINVARGDIN